MSTISSIDARFAQTQIGEASRSVAASITNLTSGKRADANVADLSVGTVLATRVGTLRVTLGNAGQAKSLLETAKGALDTVLGLLQQQKNLAVKSADDSLSDNERGFLNQEFQALVSEIDRISRTANFNGKALIDGSISGVAGTSTSTGIANEQYSLLNANDTTSTGTVGSGNLENSHAVAGSTILTFGAATGTSTGTFYIDADGSAGTAAAQSVAYTLTNGDSAATVASAFVAAAKASTSSNFNQFEFVDNGNGTVLVKAREAGAFLNNYQFSADHDGNATATIGVNGDIEDAAAQTDEKAFSHQAASSSSDKVIAGVDGIFKIVAANNIADKSINAVITFGTPSTGAGSANGSAQSSVLTLASAATSVGTARTLTLTIDAAADANGAAANSLQFGAATITIGTNASSSTHVNVVDFATADAQAAAFAVRFQALSDAGDPATDVVSRYNFTSNGADIVATLKYNGTGGTETFTITEQQGGNAFDVTEVVTAAGSVTSRDSITFGGHTIVFAENATYGIATAGANTSYVDLTVYNTADLQVQRIADLLNAIGTGNIDDYTFVADTANDTVTATQTNLAGPIAVGDVFADGSDVNNRFSSVDTAGQAGVEETSTFYVMDGNGNTVGTGIEFTLAANTSNTPYTAADVAAAFVAAYNADRTSASRLFDVTDNGNGTVNFVSKVAGVDLNNYSVAIDREFATQYTASISGSTIADGTTGVKLNTITANLQGSNKDIAASALTFDSNLLGKLSNLKGTFSLGTGNNGISDVNNNTAQFTIDVNGVTYTSNTVQLLGSSASSTISNTIAAGTKITFQRASGPVDQNGAYTNAAFQLTVESDINLATVTNSSTGQNSLNTVVSNLQNQIDSIFVGQTRSMNLKEINASSGDHRITAAIGTILEGLRGFDSVGSNKLAYNAGDIRMTSDAFGDAGTHGDITSFSVSRLSDTITTTINGEKFTAYLNSGNAPTIGGVQAFGNEVDGSTNNGSYNSTSKVITLGSSNGTTAKLNFYSENPDDGRVLTIDLGNVANNITQINLSTDEGEAALEAALNAVFDVSSNDSLSFQVGAASTDTIGVSIGSAKTADIYVDDQGVSQTLNISKIADAIEAGEVLDNAINNIISLISDVSAKISAFNSAIKNNQASIQNADAARSKLLDTDYAEESTKFAEARVRADAATAVLAQVNSRIQNLLQLLQQ